MNHLLGSKVLLTLSVDPKLQLSEKKKQAKQQNGRAHVVQHLCLCICNFVIMHKYFRIRWFFFTNILYCSVEGLVTASSVGWVHQ